MRKISAAPSSGFGAHEELSGPINLAAPESTNERPRVMRLAVRKTCGMHPSAFPQPAMDARNRTAFFLRT